MLTMLVVGRSPLMIPKYFFTWDIAIGRLLSPLARCLTRGFGGHVDATQFCEQEE